MSYNTSAHSKSCTIIFIITIITTFTNKTTMAHHQSSFHQRWGRGLLTLLGIKPSRATTNKQRRRPATFAQATAAFRHMRGVINEALLMAALTSGNPHSSWGGLNKDSINSSLNVSSKYRDYRRGSQNRTHK